MLAVVSALLLVSIQPAHAQTETMLYSFGSQSEDGYEPWASLVMDKKGNLYGTTYQGGAYGFGTVFKLSPSGTETVLYSFNPNGVPGDGYNPYAGLVMDKKGNFYGTTSSGGAHGLGAVFKVTPAGTETVLYSFGSQSGDGTDPRASLILDTAGNLYGTTVGGGLGGGGTVFKVAPNGGEAVVYNFCSLSDCTDGDSPYANLLMDKLGNLYGTTYNGGANSHGTVFKVTPTGTETVLYSFCPQSGCSDGAGPYAAVIMDKKGNLYGTTFYGGKDDYGTVFELSSTGTETVIYSFTDSDTDGANPFAGLVMGKKGVLYGATQSGSGNDNGVAFELSPGRKGAWTFTTLHAFNSGSGDGLVPYGTPILDKLGNLYGTTYEGGTKGLGTVYKIVP